VKLGLARDLGDKLCRVVAAAGWEPVPRLFTAMEPTLAQPPTGSPDGIILLSPAAARLAQLPPAVPCLAQGEATARALPEGRKALVSATPQAEGLFELLKATFPQGGTFFLARAERSREHLEAAAAGTPWRLLPWITHREAAVDPFPSLDGLDAVLALSPFQAELLGPRFRGLRLAWGQRTHRAFAQVGYPGSGWCEPGPAALTDLLTRFLPDHSNS
jgi:uroporphyrinogen-III synthase